MSSEPTIDERIEALREDMVKDYSNDAAGILGLSILLASARAIIDELRERLGVVVADLQVQEGESREQAARIAELEAENWKRRTRG